MKNIFLTLILSLMIVFGFSQTPQVALVKPNGTTTIHTTFDAAYTAAADDDYIYLPGGTYSTPFISKRLFIYGAGSNIDSSLTTGVTIFTNLNLNLGSSGGRIEGVYIHSNILINHSFSNYTIDKCILNSGILFIGTLSNSVITNNVIKNYSNSQSFVGSGGILLNSLLKNNIIEGNISYADFLEVDNNIFLKNSVVIPGNSFFNNNIFLDNPSQYGSTFNNNVNVIEQIGSINFYNNNILEPFSEIFENPGAGPSYNYNVHNNYHIKSTSACKNSGTDGTDRGIYGGMFPWVEGQVPSNPHIYYKNVAGTTNASGQLQVQYKVRTGN